MRSRASLILVRMYCVARYPAPTTPTPMAMGVRFWRNQRLVAENMVMSRELTRQPSAVPCTGAAASGNVKYEEKR